MPDSTRARACIDTNVWLYVFIDSDDSHGKRVSPQIGSASKKTS